MSSDHLDLELNGCVFEYYYLWARAIPSAVQTQLDTLLIAKAIMNKKRLSISNDDHDQCNLFLNNQSSSGARILTVTLI